MRFLSNDVPLTSFSNDELKSGMKALMKRHQDLSDHLISVKTYGLSDFLKDSVKDTEKEIANLEILISQFAFASAVLSSRNIVESN